MSGLRKHDRAAIGDRFGNRTVTRLLDPDRSSNESVEWRCACGLQGTSYVFNLRKMRDCTHLNGSVRHRVTKKQSDGMSHEEIAERMGITRQRVQQIEQVALRKLRAAAIARGIDASSIVDL